MYQGWFCFGGTEIINNERARGYAETASQLFDYREMVKPPVPERLIGENLFTNPGFRKTTGPVEVRRNRYVPAGLALGGSGAATNIIYMNPVDYSGGYVEVTPGERISFKAFGDDPGNRFRFGFINGVPTVGMTVIDPVFQDSQKEVSDLLVPEGVTHLVLYLSNERGGVKGFATTAGPDEFRWVFDGSQQPKVRENRFRNPVPGTLSGFAPLRCTASLVDDALRLTISEALPLGSIRANVQDAAWRAPVSPGEGVEFSAESRSVNGLPGVLSMLFYDSAGAYIDGSIVSSSPFGGAATFARGGVESTVPVGAVSVGFYLQFSGSENGAIGESLDFRRIYCGTPGPYFDGSTGAPQGYATAWEGTPNASPSYMYDADFEVSWTGAENASASVLTGQGVAGASASRCLAIQSTRFAEPGRFSIRLIPTSTSNNDSFVSFSVLPDGFSGTGMGTVHQVDPLSGSIKSDSNRIITVTNPWGVYSPIPANAPGSYPQRISIPTRTGGYSQFRINHGGLLGSGDVWWTDVGLFVGEYLTTGPNAPRGTYNGEYFDEYTEPPEGYQIVPEWSAPDTSALLTLPIPEQYAQYCDINWFQDDDGRCEHLWEALQWPIGGQPPPPDGAPPYEAEYISEDAPWFSLSAGGFNGAQMGHDFLGAYGVEVRGLSDTIRDVASSQGISDGGILGSSRRAIPSFRFRVMLMAVTESGLEFGTTWLSRSLDEAICSTHGPSCGSVDLTFFEECPRPGNPHAPRWMGLDSGQRFYHDVKCVDGPISIEEIRLPKRNIFARIVEFTLEAGNPHLYGADPGFFPVTSSGSLIVNDVPRNAIPYPSAELASTDQVILALNYSTNPSVEVNATGWSGTQSVITSGEITSGRVTGELAAVGTASYRRAFTATSSGSNGVFRAEHTVVITDDKPYSISMWAAAVVTAGSPVLGAITFHAEWKDGATSLRTDSLGFVAADGGSVTAKGLVPPAGATTVVVKAGLSVASWASGNAVRLYADAVGVMFP